VIAGSPGSELPESGLFFIIRTSRKSLFLCYCTGKETAWQKENRMKTGNFLKEKVPKTPRAITQNFPQR
jgi:hypothetical protein